MIAVIFHVRRHCMYVRRPKRPVWFFDNSTHMLKSPGPIFKCHNRQTVSTGSKDDSEGKYLPRMRNIRFYISMYSITFACDSFHYSTRVFSLMLLQSNEDQHDSTRHGFQSRPLVAFVVANGSSTGTIGWQKLCTIKLVIKEIMRWVLAMQPPNVWRLSFG